MKTKANKITDRSARKLSSILAAVISWLLPTLILIVTIESSFGASGTWQEDPNSGDGDWNFFNGDIGSNWTPNGAIPNGRNDVATFGFSNIRDVFISADTEVDSIIFTADATSPYTITAGNGFMLKISGAGIINNSGTMQNFATFLSGEAIVFTNSATAGNMTAFINQFGGATKFEVSSNAGNATIQNLEFGITSFLDNSTADNATIQNLAFGTTSFFNNSRAANAIITNSGAASLTRFLNSSTADNAIIQNLALGTTSFLNNSRAANATLIAYGGSGGGSGGTILFEDDSMGDAALVAVFGNGNLDISLHTAPGVTIGSIQGSGDVFLGARNLTVGTNNMTTIFSGVIQDGQFGRGGSLTKVGTGVLTLTGVNTYTGGTTIGSGTLQLGNGGTSGSIVGDVVNNGTFAINRSDMFTFGGVISGTGAFQQLGTGTTVLTGQNTYAGVTAVNGGTLAAGAVNMLPSQTALTVATGATFDLNNFSQSIGSLAGAGSVTLRAATLTTGNDNTSTDFSGGISGGGSLTKVGTGTLTLAGLNTYLGTTAINAGVLSISSDANLGTAPRAAVADLTFNGGTLQTTDSFALNANRGIRLLSGGGTIGVTDDNRLSYGGVITGVGSLTKTGSGRLVLSGINTYTGATTVNRGSLIVDGSIRSAQTSVNAGGLLGGNGFLGGNLLNNGIVSPGNPLGTLTVNGNYTQTPGGTLRIEIAGLGPNQHDLLAVNGTANVSGTLQLIPLNNFQLSSGEQLTILTANGGVHGTFNPIENPFVVSGTIVAVQIVSTPNSVGLEATPISPQQPAAVFSTSVAVANVRTTNLERRMERIRAGSRGFSGEDFTINSGVHEFSMGLAGPSGPEGKSGPSVMQPTPDNRWGVFVSGLGEFTDVDSTNVARGYYLSTGGLTFGADYRVSPNFAIGLIGGYAHTNADLGDNDNLDVNGGTVGVYATGWSGGFYVDTAVTGGFNGYDLHRTELLRTVSGNTDGRDFNALVAAGYDWKSGGLTIGPVASFQYTYVEFDEFTEHGSLVPLSFPDQNTDSSRTALGARASYDWHVGHIVVQPEIRASWQHEFGATEYSIVANFANGTGNNFSVNGPAIGRDSLLLGAGAAVLLNDRVTVYAYYDGELARTNYSSNGVSGGLRITF